MPIRQTDSIAPSEPGGALRLDARVSNAVVAGADGVRAIPQYGAEARMTALNLGGNAYVTTFGGAGLGPVVIPFSQVDVDYSEFNGNRQADAPAGVLTAWTEGLYEIGCQAAYSFNAANAHADLTIWTDAGATAIPVGNLQEGQPYGTRWQRIGQRNIGYLNTFAATNPSNADLPFHASTVATVVCIRQPGAGFLSALPAPCRFLFGIQTDSAQNGARVRGNAAGQTYAWMRWLGDPG